jgi:hypothetical protein
MSRCNSLPCGRVAVRLKELVCAKVANSTVALMWVNPRFGRPRSSAFSGRFKPQIQCSLTLQQRHLLKMTTLCLYVRFDVDVLEPSLLVPVAVAAMRTAGRLP